MILDPTERVRDIMFFLMGENKNKRMSGAMKVAGGCGSHSSLLKIQAKMVSVIKLYSSIPLYYISLRIWLKSKGVI